MNLTFMLHLCQMMHYHFGFSSKVSRQNYSYPSFLIGKRFVIRVLNFLYRIKIIFGSHILQVYWQSKILPHNTHSRLFPNSDISTDGKCMQFLWFVGSYDMLVLALRWNIIFCLFFVLWSIFVGFFMCKYFLKVSFPWIPNKAAMPTMISQFSFHIPKMSHQTTHQ